MAKQNKEKQHTNAVVFKMHIDFDKTEGYHNEPLLPGKIFYGRNREENQYSYNDIVSSVTAVINNELAGVCNNSAILLVNEVKVIETYSGSINVLFTVFLDALGVIGGLKDLYDCIELVKELATGHVKQRLTQEYRTAFDVHTDVIVPCGWKQHYRPSYMGFINHSAADTASCKRDAFFYYLLVSNIALLATIITLVYKAVATMYW